MLDLENFKFAYLEINEKLCKIVSSKTWESRAAQRLDFYQKIDHAKPPALLHEQLILELLQQANDKFVKMGYQDILRNCFTIQGEKVKSIMDLHQACSVLIVTHSDECEGLVNLEKFGNSSRPSLPLENIKPHPSAWLKDATS